MHKEARLYTNYKTNNETIEYRIYEGEDFVKTISPRLFFHGTKELEDKTTPANKFLIDEKTLWKSFNNNMGKMVDFNSFRHGKEDKKAAMYEYAKQNKINLIFNQ